ncbi:MAG: hypothetical protein AAGF32_07075 [Pseudomonadota bacterium]
MSEFRTEFKGDMAELRAEFRGDVAGLKLIMENMFARQLTLLVAAMGGLLGLAAAIYRLFL